MELIVFPFAFILWYLAYDTKPNKSDELEMVWKEENVIKRLKIINIMDKNN